MSKRWFETGYLRAKPQKVEAESGIVCGVKICSEGEAKGHGFHVEREFIETLTKQGNETKQGLKARFGHPNMCSEALGTFIGRFKNFSEGPTVREDGSEVWCSFADLHLSDTAKSTPNGDLHSYVLSMANNEADVFGTSIVFTPGKTYRRNKETGEKVYNYSREEIDELTDELFVECEKLSACDCVDEPAANDGLFSAFAKETVAGQITEFLDLNPQVFQVLENNPEVMEAIAQHGDKLDEFFSNYKEYRERFLQSENNIDEEAGMSEKKKVEASDKQEKKTPGDGKETVVVEEVKAGTQQENVDMSAVVDAAVKTALSEDRQRQTEIRVLGKKFGFTNAAEEFAKDDKSVEEFQAHILNKSPEDWRSSLEIKNDSTQKTEQDQENFSEGEDAVAKAKALRRARNGQ